MLDYTRHLKTLSSYWLKLCIKKEIKSRSFINNDTNNKYLFIFIAENR